MNTGDKIVVRPSLGCIILLVIILFVCAFACIIALWAALRTFDPMAAPANRNDLWFYILTILISLSATIYFVHLIFSKVEIHGNMLLYKNLFREKMLIISDITMMIDRGPGKYSFFIIGNRISKIYLSTLVFDRDSFCTIKANLLDVSPVLRERFVRDKEK